MSLALTTTQKATATATPVDAKGRPSTIDGIAVWTVNPEGYVTMFPSDDGTHCDIVGFAAGDCQVIVTGDANLQSGDKPITGVLDVSVKAAQAVGFALTVGPVEEQQ
jgi:hypothetical protein